MQTPSNPSEDYEPVYSTLKSANPYTPGYSRTNRKHLSNQFRASSKVKSLKTGSTLIHHNTGKKETRNVLCF